MEDSTTRMDEDGEAIPCTSTASADQAAYEKAAEASVENMRMTLSALKASADPIHVKMTTIARMAKAHYAKFYTKDTMGAFVPRDIQLQIVDQCLFFLAQETFRSAMLCARCGAGKTVIASMVIRCLATEAFHDNRHVYTVLLTYPKQVGGPWQETVRKVFSDYPNIELCMFDIGTNWISTDASMRYRHKFVNTIRSTAAKKHQPLAEGESERSLRGTVIFLQVPESFAKHERAVRVLNTMRKHVTKWDLTVMDESADAVRNKGKSAHTNFIRNARAGTPFMAISATPLVRGTEDAVPVLDNLLNKNFSTCNPKEVLQLFDAFAIRDNTTPARSQQNRLRLYVVKVPLTKEQEEAMTGRTHAGVLRTIQVAQVIPHEEEITKADITRRQHAKEHGYPLNKTKQEPTFIVTEVFVHIYNALFAIRAQNKGPSMIAIERLAAIAGFKKGLESGDFRVGVITGDVNQQNRDSIIQQLADGHLDVLIIQAQLGEGIDLGMCRQCFICAPDWLDSRIEQILHRIYRYAKTETDNDGRTAIIYATDGPHARHQFDVMTARFADKNDVTPVKWPEQLVSPETHMALVLADHLHLSTPEAVTDLSYNHDGADTTELTSELRDEILRDAEEKSPRSTHHKDLEYLRMLLWNQRTVTEVV